MAITALPTPPSRNDPTNFSTRADAFLGALPDFATEANALAVDVNLDAVAAAAAETAATAAAAGAQAAANVTKWVSGTTYAEGVVVWSPITYLSYRRKTAGAGTTDPSADSTNWAQAAGTGDVTLTGTQTLTNKTLTAPTIASANLTTALTLNGAAGSNGQVLTSAGSGLPTWSTISAGPTLGTPVATTSGTEVTFTGIPAGTKRITVLFKQVSTDFTGHVLVRLGTSGGIQTTGYTSRGVSINSSAEAQGASSTDGFSNNNAEASTQVSGMITLILENATSHTWVATGLLTTKVSGNDSTTTTFGGFKTLSAELDRVQVSAVSNVFDLGEVNILYE